MSGNGIQGCDEELVEEWKKDVAGWDKSNRDMLIRFNTFLGRNKENEGLYLEQLAEALSAENSRPGDVISGYRDLIRHYLQENDYEKASCYCKCSVYIRQSVELGKGRTAEAAAVRLVRKFIQKGDCGGESHGWSLWETVEAGI